MKKNKYSNFWVGKHFLDTSKYGKDLPNNIDVIELASCKRAVSNFVNIVTNKDIKVKFETQGSSYTDGDTVTISSKLTDSDFDPIVVLKCL